MTIAKPRRPREVPEHRHDRAGAHKAPGAATRPRESASGRAATRGRPYDGADRSVETTPETIARLQPRIDDLEAELQQRRLMESALRTTLAGQERLLAQERVERAGIEHASRLQREYLAVLSHDLRTPLNAVLGWARMVSRDQTDLATMRRAIEIIHRNASRQLQLLDDLTSARPATRGDASASASSMAADHGPAQDGRHDSRPNSTRAQTAAVEGSTHYGAPSQQTILKDARILVVDDDQDARDLLMHVLSEFGAAVETASSASEAVRAMSRQRFDVLLSDIGMPDRDGYALIAAVRHDPRPHVRVLPTVAVTAYAGDRPRDEALSAGYDHFVTKPIDPSRFVQLVCGLLSGRDRAPGSTSGS